MVQVSYPGVYVLEVPSGVRTITGVSTSIGAFLGRTARGPMNRATRCFSYADFERAFGGAHPRSDLAQSVRMFFANGGTDSYVVRIAKDAKQADVTLKSIGGTDVLVAKAKSAGTTGNSLQLEVTYGTPAPDETFNLSVYQMNGTQVAATESFVSLSMNPASPRYAPKLVKQQSGLIELDEAAGLNMSGSPKGFSQGRFFVMDAAGRTELEGIIDTAGAKLEVNVDDTQWVPIDLKDVFTTTNPAPNGELVIGDAWTEAALAARIETLINAQLQLVDPSLLIEVSALPVNGQTTALRIAGDRPAPAENNTVRIRRSAQADVAAGLMLGVDQGGIEVARFQEFRPAPNASVFNDVAKLLDLAVLDRGVTVSLTIDGAAAQFDFTPGSANESGNPWFRDAAGGANGVREKLRVIADKVNATAGSPWRAEVWGYHLAILARGGAPNLQPATIVSSTDATLGGANFARNVRRYALGPAGGGNPGDDGAAPTQTEYEGNENDQTGFHALDPVDLFNLMVLPRDYDIADGDFDDLWGPASNYCAGRRAFLIADPPETWTKAGAPPRPLAAQQDALVNGFRASIVKENAAVFYPNVKYRDGALIKTIGPAGMMAGLMARTDSTRGVWKAPAGLEAGLRNIVDLEVLLTDRENGVLNKNGVNALRQFPNGFVSWGARTLAGDDDTPSEWKYIPVRRFALFLEESLFRGTQWVVFEPNDEPLWASIRKNLRAFMMGLFRQGAFEGGTPDQAFYVKCDGETTTANDRNLGIVNIEVGFAPLKPAEFVVIRIQQMSQPEE